MNTILIFATQATLSLLSFGLIAGWVIYPRLRDRSLRDALTPLLLFESVFGNGLIPLVKLSRLICVLSQAFASRRQASRARRAPQARPVLTVRQ